MPDLPSQQPLRFIDPIANGASPRPFPVVACQVSQGGLPWMSAAAQASARLQNGVSLEDCGMERPDRRVRQVESEGAGTGRPARRTTEQAAEEMRRFIAENYGEALTLRRVASVVGLSPFHACRMFKRVTGQTVHGYLLHVRLRAALRMLAETHLRIVDIALQTGFASHAHLTSTFTREFEIGPAAARRVLRAGDHSRYGKIVEALGRPQG